MCSLWCSMRQKVVHHRVVRELTGTSHTRFPHTSIECPYVWRMRRCSMLMLVFRFFLFHRDRSALQYRTPPHRTAPLRRYCLFVKRYTVILTMVLSCLFLQHHGQVIVNDVWIESNRIPPTTHSFRYYHVMIDWSVYWLWPLLACQCINFVLR